MDPMMLSSLINVGGGLLSGLMGGNRLPPEMRKLYEFQMAIAKQLRQYANSAPMSALQEQQGLAQERGMLGQQQTADKNQLYSMMNLNQLGGSLPDAMSNMQSQQTGQNMALNATAMLNALQSRQSALGQASQVAGQAMGPASYQQNNSIAPLLGNLAQMWAYQKGRGPQTQSVGAGSGGVIAGGSPAWQATAPGFYGGGAWVHGSNGSGDLGGGFPAQPTTIIPGVNFNQRIG